MVRYLQRALALLLLAVALPAGASFHLWSMGELYSNASGTVQFLELTALSGGQQFMTGHTLKSQNGGTTNTYTFTPDLPGDTTGKRMLVGTQSFAALGIVTPDYIVPDNFFFIAGGTITFAEGFDVWTHPAIPTTGGLSLNRDGTTGTNSPLNFAGSSGSVPPPPAVLSVTPATLDFGGQSMGTTSPALRVTLTNNTGATVAISNVSSSNPQFVPANGCGSTIANGASCFVDVTFAPPAAAGAINATANATGNLTIASNAPSNPHVMGLAGTGEKSLVSHYYRAILNRAPDTAGKNFWFGETARMSTAGADINEVWFVMAGYFFNSTEYLSANKNNTLFVTDLYNTFYNRAPDSSGLNFWTGQINGGLPREVVLFSFMFSPEFATFTQGIFGATAARAEINMVMDFFRGILNRLPDADGFKFWVNRFRTAQCAGAGNVYAEVGSISAQFIFNPEYNNRARNNTQYVTDLYYSFLRRGGDSTGVNFWINQLNSGAKDRNTERTDFINSPEFGGRVNSVVNAGCVALIP